MRTILAVLLMLCGQANAAERINHAGRILGATPTVTVPTLFNTAQADAVVAAMQIMPVDNPWNEDISSRPVLANSSAMMTTIFNELASSRRKFNAFQEMNYVLVPDSQPHIAISFLDYPAESDPSPYPIPSNLPVEQWPTGTGSLSLGQWQQDVNSAGGDRHAIIVAPTSGLLWETWQTKLVGSSWQASNGARFDLQSNTLRTDGWTSGDAAGLPMFPALVRYDEVERGAIEHAMRVVVKHTRAAHIYPATHHASSPSTSDANTPAMGQRLRLKASTVIPGGWSNQAKAIATALKKYGCIVADNGSFFQISVTPDQRWPAGCFDDLTALVPNDFEVIQTTGPTEGPRSAGKPTASAGIDQTIVLGATATLLGAVSGTGTTVTWSAYAGSPGAVTFANASLANTTATFSAVGVYTLLLKVADAVHTPAYDALVVTVTAGSTNPVPTLTGMVPSSAVAGGAVFAMTISGSSFLGGATVTWSGQSSLLPDSVSSNQIIVTIPASYIASDGVPTVTVVNPAPGGGSSGGVAFVVSAVVGSGASSGTSSGGSGGSGGCGAGGALLGLLLLLRLRR